MLDRNSWDMASGVACRLRNGLDEDGCMRLLGEEMSSVLQGFSNRLYHGGRLVVDSFDARFI